MLPGTQAVLLHILSESSTFRKWLYLLLTHTHARAHTRFYTHSLTTSFLDNACNFYSSPEAWKYVDIENAEAPLEGEWTRQNSDSLKHKTAKTGVRYRLDPLFAISPAPILFHENFAFQGWNHAGVPCEPRDGHIIFLSDGKVAPNPSIVDILYSKNSEGQPTVKCILSYIRRYQNKTVCIIFEENQLHKGLCNERSPRG